VRYTRPMALDSKDARSASGAYTRRLDALRAVLASALPNADPSDLQAASEDMDAVLCGGAPSPGWERTLFARWQDTADGIRLAKRAIRVALHQHQLPVTGDAFEVAYDFARQAY
jgi:hypothetical protein